MRTLAASCALLLGCAAAAAPAAAPVSEGSAAAVAAPTPAAAQIAPDAEIQRLLEQRIGERRADYGIVVGVLEASGRRVVSAGSRSRGDTRPLDGDTLFEIGSITKVFTSLLLAEAVGRGEVTLADPVAKLLPASVRVPSRAGREITLMDLATHTSSLPRLPDNFAPKDQNNPYADYSVEQLYAFLSTAQLTRDVGSAYAYSNLGAGLLGHALALRAGQSYERLVSARVTGPLGMPSTRIELTPELKERLAPGHTETLEVAANWDIPTLAGAGALRSSTHDLLTFLAAASGSTPTPLAAAFALCTSPQRPTDMPDTQIGLGWHISRAHGKTITWHNGGTGGYRTFIGFDPERRAGVAVLSNVSTRGGPDDIGLHLLDPERPLAKPEPLAAPRQAIALDARVLERYVGRYSMPSSAVLSVTRDGEQLYAQLSGQDRHPIFPQAEAEFFYKVVDAQLSFESDAGGSVVAVTLHQGGRDQRAPRAADRKRVALSPASFDRYAGTYELAPGKTLSISREGERFFAQLTGQRRFEIFAAGERDFFLDDVDAQLTFETDAKGKAVAVTLHQAGRDTRAARMP
jgi:D-alanyl-D-alanine-carboxypeptidase/D-alanyl-D-alanine-endopeptidase